MTSRKKKKCLLTINNNSDSDFEATPSIKSQRKERGTTVKGKNQRIEVKKRKNIVQV